MKKAILFAAAAVGGLTLMVAPIQAKAASTQKQAVKTQVITVQKNCLKEELDTSKWGNCTIITIPCLPEMENPESSKPEKPESSKPEQPETENPESSKPETDTSLHTYALRVVELVNEERVKAGLAPVTLQEDVTKAAQVRALEIEKSFSHTRPNGSSFSTALKEAGVSYRGSGENIAWGQKTPEQVMRGWMNSDGHRANILNPKYTSIGVGYYQNASGVNYWTQLFTY